MTNITISEKLDIFEKLVNSSIIIDPSCGIEDDICTKVQIIVKIAEALKYKYPHFEKSVSLHEVVNFEAQLSKDSKTISLKRLKKKPKIISEHISSASLELPLLCFLFANYGKYDMIFTIINNFLLYQRSSLSLGDFETTKTGVTRFFTNTRFAARALREGGLLKFTKKEAYKTWELSVIGLIVGNYLFSEGSVQKIFERITDKKLFQAEIAIFLKKITIEKKLKETLLNLFEISNVKIKNKDDVFKKIIPLFKQYSSFIDKAKLSKNDYRMIDSIRENIENQTVIKELLENYKPPNLIKE